MTSWFWIHNSEFITLNSVTKEQLINAINSCYNMDGRVSVSLIWSIHTFAFERIAFQLYDSTCNSIIDIYYVLWFGVILKKTTGFSIKDPQIQGDCHRTRINSTDSQWQLPEQYQHAGFVRSQIAICFSKWNVNVVLYSSAPSAVRQNWIIW